MQDSSGNIYGTTQVGGGSNDGTAFIFTPSNTFATLHGFTGGATDGKNPESQLVLDSSGNLYGTTYSGGGDNGGTVFKLTKHLVESLLYTFTGGGDGANPVSGVTEDSAGNLYGTTFSGGDLTCGFDDGGSVIYGCGTVFKLTGTTLTTLDTFELDANGGAPENIGGLAQDGLGNLYGTTAVGGMYSYGTVFKMTPSGSLTTLYSFDGMDDGCFPLAAPVFDASGNLYGTTSQCGILGRGAGTVWKLSSDGTFTTLYSFTGNSDGAHPVAPVVLDSAGNLYGVAGGGGDSNGDGTVFQISASGAFVLMHVFDGADGSMPQGGLVLGSGGILYGTTYDGGPGYVAGEDPGYGTIWAMPTTAKAVYTLTVTTGGTGTGTINSIPAGISCPGTCSMTVNYGTQITLIEVPRAGSAFGGWSGSCSGVSSCQVTMQSAASVTATFNSTQATSTTLTSSAGSLVFNQPVTFTATVGAKSGTPTGSVTFYMGSMVVSQPLLSGMASFTTSALPLGNTPVTASYSGDSNYASSMSTGVSESVSQAGTTLALTSSHNPSALNQKINFMANVTGQYGGLPTGSVTFYDGATLLEAKKVAKGVATYGSAGLTAGNHSITAVYGGDPDFNGSSSPAVNQVVNGAYASKTALTAAPSKLQYGQQIGLTATVTAPNGGGIPDGTVVFKVGSTVLGTVALTNGVATLNTTALPGGKDSVNAMYSGSSGFEASSGSYIVTVGLEKTTTTLTPSANPSQLGKSVTFTATIAGPSGGGTPTGTVTFTEGSTLLCSVNLSHGSAKCSIDALTKGKHGIKAVYPGSTKCQGSSATVVENVE